MSPLLAVLQCADIFVLENQYAVHDFQDAKVNIYGTEPENERRFG